MDRFPQSQFFGINDGPKVPKLKILFLLRVVEKYCFRVISKYKPDVVLKLSLDFDTSISRKPNHDPEIIRDKIEILNQINFDNMVDIDAKQSLDKVILDVKNTLWKKIALTDD